MYTYIFKRERKGLYKRQEEFDQQKTQKKSSHIFKQNKEQKVNKYTKQKKSNF